MMLCFASYEDKVGMYYQLEVSLEDYDKKEVADKVQAYYSSINVEEYLLADCWEDDSEILNAIIHNCYSECFGSFQDSIQAVFDHLDRDLDDISIDEWTVGILAYGKDYLIRDLNVLTDVNVYDDVDDYYEYLLGLEENPNQSDFKNLWYWLSESQRFDYLEAQGYNVTRLDGGACGTWEG